jgi:hypothetical protein
VNSQRGAWSIVFVGYCMITLGVETLSVFMSLTSIQWIDHLIAKFKLKWMGSLLFFQFSNFKILVILTILKFSLIKKNSNFWVPTLQKIAKIIVGYEII